MNRFNDQNQKSSLHVHAPEDQTLHPIRVSLHHININGAGRYIYRGRYLSIGQRQGRSLQ